MYLAVSFLLGWRVMPRMWPGIKTNVVYRIYEAHDVPEERQYVPAVVIGERYLFLGVEIIDELMDALMAGEGLQTPLLNGQERVSDPL